MNQRGSPIGGRRQIRSRVFVLVTIGMLAPLAVMAWAGWTSFGELQRRVLAERELLAHHISERLGEVLSSELEALAKVATVRGIGSDPGSLELARPALRHVFSRRHLFDEVFLLDQDGRVVLQEPGGGHLLDGKRLVAEARCLGRPFFSNLFTDATGTRRLYALVPVRDDRHRVRGVLGGMIDAGGPHLAKLLASDALSRDESIDLIDGEGVIIASTAPFRRFRASDHRQFLANLIRDRRAASGICHGCHDPDESPVREVFAFSPLAISPWGVSVRQPEQQAYAFAATLFRHVAMLVAGLLALSLLFAYGASLSVTGPLDQLTQAAELITTGQLDVPIPPLALDEVGRLGTSLERMRLALRSSRARLEQANNELEQRVEARTAELASLNVALKEREEARTLALRKVISVQEDERKRIARELHDETSQSLAALAISLDSTAKSLGGEERRKVEEAKAVAVRTLAEVQRLMVDLRPSVLDDLGLQAAIDWYAQRCLGEKGIWVRCEFSGLEERLPLEVETTLFRTAQEAMTNIARHSKAERVLVQCSRRDAEVTLELEDDGVGFDASAVSAPDTSGRGLGLLGMRERVDLLGGSFQLDSAPGEGTRLSLTVPLRRETPHG